eukprot:SAG22_NODE_151_length_17414_cov_7.812128_14_plen_222_part_00
MVGQLGWIFPAWNASYSADDKMWRWQDQVQLELFGAQVATLLPALLAPFPAAHPKVSVSQASDNVLPVATRQCAASLTKACADDKATGTEAECEDCVTKAVTAGLLTNCTAAEQLAFCGAVTQPVRARAWALPAAANATESACTYLVVVNVDEERPAQCVLALDPPPPAGSRAARLFEAGYEVVISEAGALAAELIAPGSVNVYGIGGGCKRLPGAPSTAV